jgi:hypothetical protein
VINNFARGALSTMIILKKCRIRNWDGSEITPVLQIQERIRLKLSYLNLVQRELAGKTINRRFHDEPRRVINDLIRWCHGAMGMYAGSDSGCLYVEKNLVGSSSTVEHVIPVSDLVEMYFSKNLPLPLLLFFPVAKISKISNERLRLNAKTNKDHTFPFRRYFESGIDSQIITHTGVVVDFKDFSIRDHFNTVKETATIGTDGFNEDFAKIYETFRVGDLITSHKIID